MNDPRIAPTKKMPAIPSKEDPRMAPTKIMPVTKKKSFINQSIFKMSVEVALFFYFKFQECSSKSMEFMEALDVLAKQEDKRVFIIRLAQVPTMTVEKQAPKPWQPWMGKRPWWRK